MTAILTSTAELAAWVLIAFGGSVIFMVLWAAGGIGSHRIHKRHHTPRNHGEGDGVGELGVGQVHGKGL